jgi:hypothetical protein
LVLPGAAGGSIAATRCRVAAELPEPGTSSGDWDGLNDVITLPHWTQKMYRARKTTVNIKSTHPIRRFCAPGATAFTRGSGYGPACTSIHERVSVMLDYVVSEGRLFALKPSEWSMLLGGVTLCGLLALLFG